MSTLVKSILDQKGQKIISLTGEETLLEAINILCRHKIGAALILFPNQQLRGIFSERDVIHSIEQHGADVLKEKVHTFMTTQVICCQQSDTTGSLMEQMTEGRFRHMPVLENNKVVGIISIGDVVKSYIRDIESEVSSMRDYINQ